VGDIDLGGQEHFRFFHEGLVTGASILLMVFDVTRIKTLFSLREWIPIIQQIPRERWILVGNKLDDIAMITEEDIIEKSMEWGIPWITVSAKEGSNFENLMRMILTIKDH
jgi:GTPase SAR1 family protein